MAGSRKVKTQQSITTFFSVGSKSPQVAKRKATELETPDVEHVDSKLSQPPPIVKDNKPSKLRSTSEPKKRKLVMEDENESLSDIKMVQIKDKEGDGEEKDELIRSPREKLSIKKGRRRLRQRIVDDDEEEFSDDGLSLTNKSMAIDLSMSDEEKLTEKENVSAMSMTEGKEETTESIREAKEQAPDTEMKTFADVETNEEDVEEKIVVNQTSPPSSEKEVDEVDIKEKVVVTPFSSEKDKNVVNEKKMVVVNSTIPLSSIQEKKQTSDSIIASWNQDESTVPYTTLAHVFHSIENTSGRLVIQDLMMQYFRQVLVHAPQDLLPSIYLCVCTDLAPPFENLKIGIGDAILMKAISEATGSTPKFIKEMYQKEGDLGKVAQNARSKQHTLSFTSIQSKEIKPTVLSVNDVYQQFVKIAKMTGNNSQQVKCSLIKSLLVKCEKDKKVETQMNGTPAEGAKYIIRGLQGKLRIGLAEKTILIGLTYSFMLMKDINDKDKQEKALGYVKKAFAECPSYTALVEAFQKVQAQVSETQYPFLRVSDFEKVAQLCVLSPGTPVSPMLARPTKAYAMVFDRFQGQPFTCEYKYDGERAQIHILPDGEIAIFSRNFENSTERFPDVKLMMKKAIKHTGTSCIVDAEVVAVDKTTNKRLPFQILSTRSRKNVKVEEIKVPVCIYAFDLLYLNGMSLLKEPLKQRRELLRQHFQVDAGSFEFASSLDIDTVGSTTDDMEIAVDKVRTFLEEAVKENCEGLMVKTIEKDATYEPANRSHKWLKLKKDYLDGIGDSTDLVPIGAFYGRGKRTGVYGAYLLACYDPDTEMFQAITKLGTGLSDEKLKEFYEQLKENVVDRIPSDYLIADGIKPDVWFESSCVWEILGADLSISPKYTAGMGLVAKDKGISLRFPRFLRVREDKSPNQATTSSQIADLYRAQDLVTVNTGDDDDDDDMMI